MSTKNVISKNGVWKTAPLNDSPSSGGGVLVVTETDGTLDKTWQEIHDAFVAGSVRIQNLTSVIMNVKIVGYSSREGLYSVVCENYQTDETYTTDSASGYPHL